MTYLCSIFFIFVASVDPLSKNKSRIIIQKCRIFCKQLTLPGRTVQQLPFFKTVRLYTVVCQTCLIDLYRKMTDQFRRELFDDSVYITGGF